MNFTMYLNVIRDSQWAGGTKARVMRARVVSKFFYLGPDWHMCRAHTCRAMPKKKKPTKFFF